MPWPVDKCVDASRVVCRWNGSRVHGTMNAKSGLVRSVNMNRARESARLGPRLVAQNRTGNDGLNEVTDETAALPVLATLEDSRRQSRRLCGDEFASV